MIRRTIVGFTALFLGLSLGLNVAAAAPCDDGECRTAPKAKPLDIMQFMREQAASTRVAAKPRHGNVAATAKVQRPARRTIAARPKPTQLPSAASASFASQPEPAVQVTPSDVFNTIEGAAPAPVEAVGAAIAAEPNVQLVDAQELNDIDRKASDQSPLTSDGGRVAEEHPSDGSAQASWPRRIWWALGNLFGALATAAHQLTGLGKTV